MILLNQLRETNVDQFSQPQIVSKLIYINDTVTLLGIKYSILMNIK